MTSRGPTSPYELRIDFEGIARAQNRRHTTTLVELRSVLFKMQGRTLLWVDTNLVRGGGRTSIAGYSLPIRQRYRAVLRKRMEMASRKGHSDVQKELDAKALPYRATDRARSRERADTLAEAHLGRLTQDLKAAWNLAMQGAADSEHLSYVTRKAFADFAGWEEPTP